MSKFREIDPSTITSEPTAAPRFREVDPSTIKAQAIPTSSRGTFSTVDGAGGAIDIEDDGTFEKMVRPVPALATAQAVKGIGGKIQQLGEDPIGFMQNLNPVGAMTRAVMRRLGVENPTLKENSVSRYGKELADEGAMVEKQIETDNPLERGSVANSVRSGLSSTYMQLPGTALGVGAGSMLAKGGAKLAQMASTAISLIPMGAITEGESYHKLRKRGFDPGTATSSAYVDGVIEVATELLPTARWMKMATGKAKFGIKQLVGQFLKYGGEEYVGECLATLGQQVNDKFMSAPGLTNKQRMAEVGKYLTSGEVWDDLVETMKVTTVQTLAMGLLGGAARGAANIGTVPEDQRPPVDHDILNPQQPAQQQAIPVAQPAAAPNVYGERNTTETILDNLNGAPAPEVSAEVAPAMEPEVAPEPEPLTAPAMSPSWVTFMTAIAEPTPAPEVNTPVDEAAAQSHVSSKIGGTNKIGNSDVTFADIPFERKEFVNPQDINDSTMRNVSGVSSIVDYSGRKLVIAVIDGVRVPFYLSTGHGGKADVTSGKWYPVFGVGADGWLNKTSGKEINSYYGSEKLKNTAQWLDSTVGDIRNDSSIEKVGATGVHFDAINEGLSPTENHTKDTVANLRSNIDSVLRRLDVKAEAAAEPQGNITDGGDGQTGLIPEAQAEAETNALPETVLPSVDGQQSDGMPVLQPTDGQADTSVGQQVTGKEQQAEGQRGAQQGKAAQEKAQVTRGNKTEGSLLVAVDAIPEGLEVVTTMIREKTGEQVTMLGPARQTLERFDATLDRLRGLLECVT